MAVRSRRTCRAGRFRAAGMLRYAYARLENLAAGGDIDILYGRDVWDARHLGIEAHRISFASISPGWLRDATKRCARFRLATGTKFSSVAGDVAAIGQFSRFLVSRPAPANNEAAITRAVIEDYLLTLAGSQRSPATRTLLVGLKVSLEHTHRHDLLPRLPVGAVGLLGLQDPAERSRTRTVHPHGQRTPRRQDRGGRAGTAPQEFLHATTGISMGDAHAIAEKFPWDRYQTVIDSGTAEGCVPVQSRCATRTSPVGDSTCRRSPRSSTPTSPLSASPTVCASTVGDFFADPLPSADVLVMGHLLHDWSLDEKLMLLRKAYEALPAGGALIVYERIIDDDRRANTFGLLMSLNMLIETRTDSTTPVPTASRG